MVNRLWSRLLISLAAAAIMTFLLPGRPAAGAGITVSGASLIAEVSPGEKLAHKITITGGSACDIVLRVCGAAQATDGTYVLLDALSDTGPYSARPFITLEKETLHLEAGTPGEVTATVAVPQDAGEGGRYTLINISTVAEGSSGVGTMAAINIPVYLTLKNTRLDHSGYISGISTGDVTSGSPVAVFTDFYNAGNHHYKIKGETVISDGSGKVLDVLYSSLTSTSLLPSMTRRLETTFIPEHDLSPGTYGVKSWVMLVDGTVLDEKSSSFEVKIPYTPPPPPAGGTVSPDAASTVETTGGRISVYFPAGAVTESATVKINNLPVSQLPPLPEGYTAAATCFRIGGLPGLLVKKATLKVQYTAADLEAAGGSSTRLRLARWSSVDQQWYIVDTTIYESNKELSAKTDRFSAWAVIVSPVSKSNLPLMLAVLFAASIILIIFTLLKKRKT